MAGRGESVRAVAGGVWLVAGPVLAAIAIFSGRAHANGSLIALGLIAAASSSMLWIHTAEAVLRDEDSRS